MFIGDGEEDVAAEQQRYNDALTATQGAETKKAVMTADANKAAEAIANLPKALGAWGLIFAFGAYWVIVRPLLK